MKLDEAKKYISENWKDLLFYGGCLAFCTLTPYVAYLMGAKEQNWKTSQLLCMYLGADKYDELADGIYKMCESKK